MGYNVTHSAALDGSSRQPSVGLWGKQYPLGGAGWSPAYGAGHFDDFLSFTPDASVYEILAADVGSTVALIATEVAGCLRLASDGTANDEVAFGFPLAAGVVGKFSEGYGFYFETRFRVSSPTVYLKIGLVQEGGVAADFVADTTGAISDADFVGFRTLAADVDGLDAVYRTAGAAEVVVDEESQVLVADTWYKVGVAFDGTGYVKYLVNGIKKGEVLTTATDFPDGEEMGFMIGFKAGGTACNLDVDWAGTLCVLP